MKTRQGQSGLSPLDFQPDTKLRAHTALERMAFAYTQVSEVERRDSPTGTVFVVWASEEIPDLPGHVLGYEVQVRIESDAPSLMA